MAATATLSSKFQITIPAEARRLLGLQAGRSLEVRIKRDRIELVPQEPVSALVGMLRGQSSAVTREKDRV
jgi:AbrB family looped-hinge helix DNA binding protein